MPNWTICMRMYLYGQLFIMRADSAICNCSNQ